ncbi:16S rRNA (cytosine(967)-C(5))-methyltransferase RsmB [Salinicoccus sp. ID82-1]|uniref:16S rRNA (cytosine(967)-C(5))-methyltransferase RsmB n=1 Tax=Salinicoccus sp. ID82-1 TaxID=2820269 RepID=UPI001F02B6C3|nr:16S rRNA (cytosine(967)-C(5))-methyltransferase RsmB [Salinicoccus sp. ID82-1]MCG1008674.1 16S rRNA (cytosine(967)-C(5))-methyltransferase RsmB [Salinicoccus sp. ID82-1]
MQLREMALDAYSRVVDEGGFSNIVLNDMIRSSDLASNDRGLLTEIVYGTISKKLTIQFHIRPFIRTKLKRWQRNLLDITVYQIVWLDRVPNYAAINEAVEIAKKRGGPLAGKAINGILRSFEREPLQDVAHIRSETGRLSIETSIPEWIISHWKTHHGIDGARGIAHALNNRPKLYVRTNTARITRKELVSRLLDEGLGAIPSDIQKDAIEVKGEVLQSALYEQGLFSIQDVSSMLVNDALSPQPDDIILDACSAPGGKGLHALEKVPHGHVDLSDIHEHKIPLIEQQAERLELTGYDVFQGDATRTVYPRQYDRIIVDAPCSGLGVIRRKPEIRYERKAEDIDTLVDLQLEILSNIKNYLKPGGVLIYSTCTIHQMENENVAYTFMKQNDDIEFDPFVLEAFDFEGPYRQILPQEAGTDGFFIARFRKKEK